MKLILRSIDHLSTAQRFILGDLLDQITYLIRKESTVDNGISRSVINDRNVNLLKTIPGMGIYSSAAIMSETHNIIQIQFNGEACILCWIGTNTESIGIIRYKGTYNKTWIINAKIHIGHCCTQCYKIFRSNEEEITQHS